MFTNRTFLLTTKRNGCSLFYTNLSVGKVLNQFNLPMVKKEAQLLENAKGICTYYDDEIIIFNDIRKMSAAEIPLNTIVADTNVVLYCAAGTISLNVNDEPYSLVNRQILICPPNADLNNYVMSEDCFCHAISLSSGILQNALKNNISIWNKCLYVDKVNLLTLSEESEALWVKYYDLMATKIHFEEVNAYDSSTMQSIVFALVLELCGRMVQNASDQLKRRMNEQIKQSSNIFKNFLDLLNNTPVKYHPVEYYASQLCVTPKYLANVCREESGKSAIAWIQERVIHDIRFLLSNPDVSIKEIAVLTGFETISLFGRFVRTHMGTSPRELRKKI